jgi:UDP:flavonoid glycosyltransferase YjiC (YdhE family)
MSEGGASVICLLPNCCFLSETSRMVEIYRALLTRGVSARVATHGGTHEQVLRDAGIPYDVVGPRVTGARCQAFVRSIPGIGPANQSMWSDEEMRTYVEAEVAYFREHGVRVAVTGWTLTALLSTRVVGIPLVTEHAGSFLPPVFERGLLPAPSGRIGMPLERWLPKPVRRRLFNAGVERLHIYTGGFNRLAGELGVDGVPSFAALMLGDLTLVTDVPEVLGVSRGEVEGWTPRHRSRYRPGTRLRYTGPMYAKLAVPVPERVEAFLAGPRPIVYVAITSSTAELVRVVVRNLRSIDVRILVAATVHDIGDLEDERVLVAGVLPNHEVMPRVDLAVTAGGQGSIQAALASGVPVIGIPLQPEQDANVELAERQGAARLVTQREAGTTVLARTTRKMLADHRYREHARRLSGIFAGVDGPGAAADAIIELLGEGDGRQSRPAPKNHAVHAIPTEKALPDGSGP